MSNDSAVDQQSRAGRYDDNDNYRLSWYVIMMITVTIAILSGMSVITFLLVYIVYILMT